MDRVQQEHPFLPLFSNSPYSQTQLMIFLALEPTLYRSCQHKTQIAGFYRQAREELHQNLLGRCLQTIKCLSHPSLPTYPQHRVCILTCKEKLTSPNKPDTTLLGRRRTEIFENVLKLFPHTSSSILTLSQISTTGQKMRILECHVVNGLLRINIFKNKNSVLHTKQYSFLLK